MTLANTNSYAGGTNISQGTLRSAAPNATGPGAVAVSSGATWNLGADSHTITGLTGGGNVIRTAIASGPTYFTTNAGSGISTSKTYVQLLDFAGGSGTVVNGVSFGTDTSHPNWSLSLNPSPAAYGGGYGNYVSDGGPNSGMNQLFSDFYYGGNPGVLTLTGLTSGQTYEARLYQRQFGAVGSRLETMTFSEAAGVSNQLSFDEDGATPSYISYRFVAQSDTLTISAAPQDPSCHVPLVWRHRRASDDGRPDIDCRRREQLSV